MKRRHLWLLSGALVVGFVVLASPPPVSALPLCGPECSCTSSCSTACVVLESCREPGGPPCWEQVETTCGGFGVCVGSASCDQTPSGCPAQECTTSIWGTSGNDTLNGGSNRECIYGQGGNDTIDGNAGDDIIYCGAGTDTAHGDSGNDCLFGEGDDDYLDGESGTDLADGGTGSDTCLAEATANCP